jgi:mannitol/fructose-specific phosphotransferase system IIA component (Ntr-type)
MLLHEILRPELIKTGLEAEHKREAISELVDVLVQYHEIPMNQRDILLEGLYENEHALGSGMEQGIALPHLATDRVEDIICAVGTAPRGVPFGTLDGAPARIVVLLLVPKKNFEGEVQAIAGVQHLLRNSALVADLLKAVSPRDAYKLIQTAEEATIVD